MQRLMHVHVWHIEEHQEGHVPGAEEASEKPKDEVEGQAHVTWVWQALETHAKMRSHRRVGREE